MIFGTPIALVVAIVAVKRHGFRGLAKAALVLASVEVLFIAFLIMT